MSSILPKGIVVNTPEISGDIQKIDREPLALDEIAKFWKVYTTTKRRLVDPTAERLENFWWRIWGSRQRSLRGATVARIFTDISNEISFVPLRGPLNRDESGGRSTAPFTRGPGTASTTAIHGIQESDSSNERHSSSLSKSVVAMPPPILKKSRGPSSTGPRPTARFISPHTSEDDDTAELPPATKYGAHVVIRPPTPPHPPVSQRARDDKKAEDSARPRKKVHGHVTTTGGHRRRPGAPRRPNSDPAAKAHENGSTSLSKDICKSLPEKANERPNAGMSQNPLDVSEKPSPSPETLMPIITSKKNTRSGRSAHSKPFVRQSSQPRLDIPYESTTGSTTFGLQDEVEIPHPLRPTEEKHDHVSKEDRLDSRTQSKVHEDVSQGAYPESLPAASSQYSELQESSLILHIERVSQHPLSEHHHATVLDGKSSSSVAPAYITAEGETVQRNRTGIETAEHQGISFLQSEIVTPSGGLEQPSLFAKRPVEPVRSSSALLGSSNTLSNDSMSRSKSQLTLLLERDGTRSKENKDKASKTKDAKSR